MVHRPSLVEHAGHCGETEEILLEDPADDVEPPVARVGLDPAPFDHASLGEAGRGVRISTSRVARFSATIRRSTVTSRGFSGARRNTNIA